MIRPLRRVHRWCFIALAILLPLLLWKALAVRPTPAVMPQLPPALEGEP